MGTFLPWWLLVVPAILVLADSIISPKTSSMGMSSVRPAGAVPGRAL